MQSHHLPLATLHMDVLLHFHPSQQNWIRHQDTSAWIVLVGIGLNFEENLAGVNEKVIINVSVRGSNKIHFNIHCMSCVHVNPTQQTQGFHSQGKHILRTLPNFPYSLSCIFLTYRFGTLESYIIFSHKQNFFHRPYVFLPSKYKWFVFPHNQLGSCQRYEIIIWDTNLEAQSSKEDNKPVGNYCIWKEKETWTQEFRSVFKLWTKAES